MTELVFGEAEFGIWRRGTSPVSLAKLFRCLRLLNCKMEGQTKCQGRTHKFKCSFGADGSIGPHPQGWLQKRVWMLMHVGALFLRVPNLGVGLKGKQTETNHFGGPPCQGLSRNAVRVAFWDGFSRRPKGNQKYNKLVPNFEKPMSSVWSGQREGPVLCGYMMHTRGRVAEPPFKGH